MHGGTAISVSVTIRLRGILDQDFTKPLEDTKLSAESLCHQIVSALLIWLILVGEQFCPSAPLYSVSEQRDASQTTILPTLECEIIRPMRSRMNS